MHNGAEGPPPKTGELISAAEWTKTTHTWHIKKKTIQGQENPSTNISNSNLLKITQKKHVEKSVSKQSHYFVTSGRQRGTWEIWADVKGGGAAVQQKN